MRERTVVVALSLAGAGVIVTVVLMSLVLFPSRPAGVFQEFDAPITQAERDYVSTPLSEPTGDPTIVVSGDEHPAFHLWEDHEEFVEEASGPSRHTRFFLVERTAMEVDRQGRSALRRVDADDARLLEIVVEELQRDRRGDKIDVVGDELDRLQNQLERATTPALGPFIPRYERLLNHFGFPDRVREYYFGTPILEEDRVDMLVFRERDRVTVPRPSRNLGYQESIVHASWADYLLSYTTLDGVSTTQRGRSWIAFETQWLYEDEQAVIFPDSAFLRDVVEQGSPLDDLLRPMQGLAKYWEVEDPVRYKRLQTKLRERATLATAVTRFIEERIALLEASGDNQADTP